MFLLFAIFVIFSKFLLRLFSQLLMPTLSDGGREMCATCASNEYNTVLCRYDSRYNDNSYTGYTNWPMSTGALIQVGNCLPTTYRTLRAARTPLARAGCPCLRQTFEAGYIDTARTYTQMTYA